VVGVLLTIVSVAVNDYVHNTTLRIITGTVYVLLCIDYDIIVVVRHDDMSAESGSARARAISRKNDSPLQFITLS